MKINIISDLENVLLGRRDIVFYVSHPSSGTPTRIEVQSQIAAMLNIEPDCVYVASMLSKTGGDSTEGTGRVYDSSERARLVERDHILKRNTPPGEVAQAGEEAQAKQE